MTTSHRIGGLLTRFGSLALFLGFAATLVGAVVKWIGWIDMPSYVWMPWVLGLMAAGYAAQGVGRSFAGKEA